MSEPSDYEQKVLKELSNFDQLVNVHALPDIYHYWSQKYLLPKIIGLRFRSLQDFFLHYILRSARKARRQRRRMALVSFGAGNCEFEVELAAKLIKSGVTNFHFTCLELNQAMLDRGLELAASNSCAACFAFVTCDLNSWVADEEIDIAFASHSLHHVVALESLFDQIAIALRQDGTFLINDMIGRNGHQRWPEAEEVVKKFWAELPSRYKYNHQHTRSDDEFINWDCSTEGFEGVRSQDILPELIKRFSFDTFLGFGNVIDIFIDRSYGHNFNLKSAEDCAVIDRIAQEDDRLIEAGILKPTHMLAALKHETHPGGWQRLLSRFSSRWRPRYYKDLTPKSSVRWPDELNQPSTSS